MAGPGASSADCYARLRGNAWGANIHGPRPSVGDDVELTRRDGKTRIERVAKVLYSNPAGTRHLVALLPEALVRRPRPPPPRR